MPTLAYSKAINASQRLCTKININGDYIKGDNTNHISPKFFYTYEIQHKKKINIK